ncbi:uncharacterized protein LOC124291422 [Haliotis rubra]|uniref:uncharacterized protein LOC124291422 n=1 Tax=Haliotis rubra TaxID=36100 RepID=UPI001EE635BB|nr:uncharacterized protein LOC124291422 [Haliotis rubra]
MVECGVVVVVALMMLLGAVASQTTEANVQTTISQHGTTQSRFEGRSAKQDLRSGDRLNNASMAFTLAKCTTGGSRTGNNASDGCFDDTSDDPRNNTGAIDVKCNEEDGNITICKTTNSKRVSLISMGSLSKANYVKGEKICRYIFYPLLTSAVLFNTFNLLVYTDPAMRSPTSTYLIALATDELLFALLSSVRHILRQAYGTDSVKKQAYLYFALFGSNFCLATLRVLMYCLTVLVSTERFLAVAFPLNMRKVVSQKRGPTLVWNAILKWHKLHKSYAEAAVKDPIKPQSQSAFSFEVGSDGYMRK